MHSAKEDCNIQTLASISELDIEIKSIQRSNFIQMCFYLLTLKDEAVLLPTKSKIDLRTLKGFTIVKFITFIICCAFVHFIDIHYKLSTLLCIALMVAVMYIVLTISINILALIQNVLKTNEKSRK